MSLASSPGVSLGRCGATRRLPRRGVQMAWLVWAVLFGVALSPIDPLATLWDEVALGTAALIVLWRRLFDEHRTER